MNMRATIQLVRIAASLFAKSALSLLPMAGAYCHGFTSSMDFLRAVACLMMGTTQDIGAETVGLPR